METTNHSLSTNKPSHNRFTYRLQVESPSNQLAHQLLHRHAASLTQQLPSHSLCSPTRSNSTPISRVVTEPKRRLARSHTACATACDNTYLPSHPPRIFTCTETLHTSPATSGSPEDSSPAGLAADETDSSTSHTLETRESRNHCNETPTEPASSP